MVNEHGGNIYRNDVFYDFSANIDPLGLPENVKNALVNSIDMWDKYPDPYCTELTEKLSAKIGVVPENIVCGNGAADLIYRIIYTFKPKNAFFGLLYSACVFTVSVNIHISIHGIKAERRFFIFHRA